MTELQLLWMVFIVASALSFLDASLGMGYGTTLTVLLMLMNYQPEQIILPILISGFISGILSSFFHVLYKNIKVSGEKHVQLVKLEIGDERTGNYDNVKFSLPSKGMSLDTKIIIVFTTCGIFSALAGAVFSTLFYGNDIANFIIKMYIAFLVMSLGSIMILLKDKRVKFSFGKIVFIGGLAGFNKSISGGGFGPVVVTGQMMLGRGGKESIASTAISEAIISVTGIASFILTDLLIGGSTIDYTLTIPLLLGACLIAPIAPLATKKIKKEKIQKFIAAGLIALSFIILFKIIVLDGGW
ncbi:MAG: TSUP family transporter [Promethearchaeota archaeon]